MSQGDFQLELRAWDPGIVEPDGSAGVWNRKKNHWKDGTVKTLDRNGWTWDFNPQTAVLLLPAQEDAVDIALLDYLIGVLPAERGLKAWLPRIVFYGRDEEARTRRIPGIVGELLQSPRMGYIQLSGLNGATISRLELNSVVTDLRPRSPAVVQALNVRLKEPWERWLHDLGNMKRFSKIDEPALAGIERELDRWFQSEQSRQENRPADPEERLDWLIARLERMCDGKARVGVAVIEGGEVGRDGDGFLEPTQVLLVEDDASEREAICKRLHKCGLKPIPYGNAQDALEWLILQKGNTRSLLGIIADFDLKERPDDIYQDLQGFEFLELAAEYSDCPLAAYTGLGEAVVSKIVARMSRFIRARFDWFPKGDVEQVVACFKSYHRRIGVQVQLQSLPRVGLWGSKGGLCAYYSLLLEDPDWATEVFDGCLQWAETVLRSFRSFQFEYKAFTDGALRPLPRGAEPSEGTQPIFVLENFKITIRHLDRRTGARIDFDGKFGIGNDRLDQSLPRTKNVKDVLLFRAASALALRLLHWYLVKYELARPSNSPELEMLYRVIANSATSKRRNARTDLESTAQDRFWQYSNRIGLPVRTDNPFAVWDSSARWVILDHEHVYLARLHDRLTMNPPA